MLKLNENISYIIDLNRLKQQKFAEIVEVSIPVVSSWIIGRASPKYDKLLLISEKFNVSVDDLLKTDLSKQAGNVGLLGAIPEINLDTPYKADFLNEDAIKYITVDSKFKNKLLALILKDAEIKKAIVQTLKESINIK